MSILKDYTFRRWLYGVIAAAFAVASGYGIITSEQTELWLKLAEAGLDLLPAAALTLAAVKAKPAATDDKDGYVPRHAA